MNKNKRIEFKKEIEILIFEINESRGAAPKSKLKNLRNDLCEINNKIFTIDKNDLKNFLELVFLKLSNVKSKNINMVKAQKHAFELWRNFPDIKITSKMGVPMK